jgi:hypothetical protein
MVAGNDIGSVERNAEKSMTKTATMINSFKPMLFMPLLYLYVLIGKLNSKMNSNT